MKEKLATLVNTETFLRWFNQFKDPSLVYGYMSKTEEAWDLCCQLGFMKGCKKKSNMGLTYEQQSLVEITEIVSQYPHLELTSLPSGGVWIYANKSVIIKSYSPSQAVDALNLYLLGFSHGKKGKGKKLS